MHAEALPSSLTVSLKLDQPYHLIEKEIFDVMISFLLLIFYRIKYKLKRNRLSTTTPSTTQAISMM